MLSGLELKVGGPKLAKKGNSADSKSQLRQLAEKILETEDIESLDDISLEDYQKIFHELLVPRAYDTRSGHDAGIFTCMGERL